MAFEIRRILGAVVGFIAVTREVFDGADAIRAQIVPGNVGKMVDDLAIGARARCGGLAGVNIIRNGVFVGVPLRHTGDVVFGSGGVFFFLSNASGFFLNGHLNDVVMKHQEENHQDKDKHDE